MYITVTVSVKGSNVFFGHVAWSCQMKRQMDMSTFLCALCSCCVVLPSRFFSVVDLSLSLLVYDMIQINDFYNVSFKCYYFNSDYSKNLEWLIWIRVTHHGNLAIKTAKQNEIWACNIDVERNHWKWSAVEGILSRACIPSELRQALRF